MKGSDLLNARIAAIVSHFPEKILANDELALIYPAWPASKIFEKTGIVQRHVVAADETAADLAYQAARKLFISGLISPKDIDFLILCTQAPDHILPTSACILQDRLGLRTDIGAFDINLGCSGFVYGLSIASALIKAGSARRVLLLTADTYSKYIHPMDKSVRTLFGDAAAATLVEAVEAVGEQNSSLDGAAFGGSGDLGPFVFGTDGSGSRNLIIPAGGFRRPIDISAAVEMTDDSGNVRTPANLYMNGAEVMAFTLRRVPAALNEILKRVNWLREEVDHFVFHQANRFMLETLRKKLKLSSTQMPVFMENCGNTVSSTIPIVLEHLAETGKLKTGQKLVLVGFGVGYSWAAAAMRA